MGHPPPADLDRRRRISDDRRRDRPCAPLPPQSDRRSIEQRRLGDLPAGRQTSGSARASFLALCRAGASVGGRGFRVETVAQLHRALEQAAKSPTFTIVEVMIAPRDLSPISVKYIRASAKKAQLKTRT
jgi:hypothetical protein